MRREETKGGVCIHCLQSPNEASLHLERIAVALEKWVRLLELNL